MIYTRTHSVARMVLGACAAVLTVLCWVPHVHAQDGITVQVQPSTIEERVDPGAVLEGELLVTNQSGGTQTYFMGTRDIVGMDENGRPTFAETAEKDGLEASAWMEPLKESITLEEGEQATVPYRISIPENASPGSYFAAFFVTREAEVATESGAGVGFHVASLVNLRVNGNVVDSMMVREFSVNKNFFTDPEIVFTTRMENTGTVHQRPQGIIGITDMLGNDVAKLTINEQAGGVMPRTDRVYENTWSPDGFVFGRYTVIASIVYGDVQRQTETRELSFWVIPVKETGAVVGGLVLLLLLIALGMRAYVRRALRKAGHTASATVSQSDLTFAGRMVRTLIRLAIVLAVLFIGMLVFFA